MHAFLESSLRPVAVLKSARSVPDDQRPTPRRGVDDRP